ncbi:hypothetical protein THOM_1636 [Trachipleistophora hominis]|uniref:Uncharacterized protein n=1 Tax=Trachipleistophora hominis TaxID=72359 RepID=L7JXG3_TRAHO|nr:hypothetical protein THOM_1636 [Trachipleistophora hominis]
MLFTLLIPHINANMEPNVRLITDGLLFEPVPNQPFDVDLHGNPDRSYYGTMRYDDKTVPIGGVMSGPYDSYAPAAGASYPAPMAAPAAPVSTYAPATGGYYAERPYAEAAPVAQPFIIADQGTSGAIMQGQGQTSGASGATGSGAGKSEGGTGKSSELKDGKSGDKKSSSKSSSKKSSKSSSKTKSSNGAASISIMSALLGVALCVILV